MMHLAGGCLCGNIRYEAVAEPGDAADYCHCTQCRRAGGAPVVVWLQLPPSRFRLMAGTPRGFASSSHSLRFFCPDCGSPLYMTDQARSSFGVTLGTLDHPELVAPTVHGWHQEKLPWLQLADSLPRHDAAIP